MTHFANSILSNKEQEETHQPDQENHHT